MKAHVIENGVIANTIAVESLDVLPNLIDASIGGSIGDSIVDGAVVPKPPPAPVVPESVSPRQIRQALTRAGLRTQVESAVAAGDQDTKDWWEFATEFQRSHPQVIAMGEALSVTPQQLDDLWVLAGSL